MELPLFGTQLQNQSRYGACRRRLPLERCDSSAEPALVFRTIKATRLSVANYNTTLSSESLETGSGGSNSLRSANESVRTDTGSGVISWAQRKPGYRKVPRAHA